MASVGVLIVLIFEVVVLLNGVEAYYNVSETNDRLRKVFCSKQYSLNCLKLDLISTAERAGGAGSSGGTAEYQLFPGVYLSHRFNTSTVTPPETLLDSARFTSDDVVVNGGKSEGATDESGSSSNVTRELDAYVTNKVNNYLSSVTLSVKLLDPNAMSQARRLSEQFVLSLFPLEKGRKKGGMWGGALWAAGSVAAVGMAALAALAGKALMTSMLAMMLAGAAALRNGGGGGKGGDCGGGHHAALIEAMHARHYDTERMASDPGFYRRSEVYTPRNN